MTKFLVPLLTLLLGVGAGWVLRDNREGDAPARTPDRLARADRGEIVQSPGKVPAPENDGRTAKHGPSDDVSFGDRVADDSSGEVVEETLPNGPKADEEEDQNPLAGMRDMLKNARPFMKMQAEQEVKQRAAELAKALGLDEERAAELEAILMDAGTRQMDALYKALEGDGGFEALIEFGARQQGLDSGIDEDAEKELSELLSPDEMSNMRTHLAEKREKKERAHMEARIEMMAIPDLTDSQRDEVRRILAEEPNEFEKGREFARAMKDPAKRRAIFEGEGLEKLMKDNSAQRRERLRNILSPKQFDAYLASEKREAEQAKMGMKMMGLFSKKKKDKK